MKNLCKPKTCADSPVTQLFPGVSGFSQRWISPFKGMNARLTHKSSKWQQGDCTMANLDESLEFGRSNIPPFANSLLKMQCLSYSSDLRGAGLSFNFLVSDAARSCRMSVRENVQ